MARLSNGALLKRLRGAADWLGEIVAAMLSERLSRRAGSASRDARGRRVLVADATTLSEPGSRKTD